MVMAHDQAGHEPGKVEHGALLGAWVRRRRADLGLTAEEVVSRMGPGVPQNYVTSIENGGRKGIVAQPRLGQLARALGASELDVLRASGLITDQPDAAPVSDPVRDQLCDLIRRVDLGGERSRFLLNVLRDFEEWPATPSGGAATAPVVGQTV